MKTKLKIVVLSIVMFVAGIAATCMYGNYFVMPDIAKDISKFAYESAYHGYQVGYTDGANNSTENYDTYFNEAVMQEIYDLEYKYIK